MCKGTLEFVGLSREKTSAASPHTLSGDSAITYSGRSSRVFSCNSSVRLQPSAIPQHVKVSCQCKSSWLDCRLYKMSYLQSLEHVQNGPVQDIYSTPPTQATQRIKLSGAAPFIPTYVKEHVTQAGDPSQMYASRVRGRHILFENLARASKASKEREERKARRLANRAKRDAAALLPRDSRRNGPWRLHQEETKFNLFLPLHQLWLGYMSELLALTPAPSAPIPDADKSAAPNAAGMHAKLVKADFHGSLMTVRRSKNPCMVGLSGIVVHETENAFKLITKKDQLKLVPKQNSIFSFSVPLYSTEPSGRGSPSETQTVLDIPHIELELYGNQFRFRAAERAGRKFKHKETIEL